MSDLLPVLYWYPNSPYGRRIVWYLNMRGIKYAQVMQPPIMPRPDLEKLGVAYRRIPVMTIGKDVYCDTRIILAKLEELYPSSKLGSSTMEGQAMEKLLENWHVEGGIFARAAACMPPSVWDDAAFAKDRSQFSGRPIDKSALEKARPEALLYIQSVFEFIEKTLLADGRRWVSNMDQPSLADFQAVWCIHWLWKMKIALPKEMFSDQQYPKTFDWLRRFDQNVTHFQKLHEATKWTGAEAAKHTFSSAFAETELGVHNNDPLKLKKGDVVEVFPTDSGMSNKDKGALIGLSTDEIVIELSSGLRLHTPRRGFRVRKVGSAL